MLLAIARDEPIQPRSMLYGGFVSSEISHGFGDVTPQGIYGGQFWRTLTATFIHFNLLHLTLNLIAFVQLGRVVESWYGSWQFLAIYVLLGAGANLLANLLRPWTGGISALIVHSGGGSTIVLGLIGLVAVVGWRNPAEFPKRAPIWMAAILLANALLGFIVPNIDNLGHAAGAVVGGLVGLLDRRLLRWKRSRRAAVAGVLGVIMLMSAAFVQMQHRQAEQETLARITHWGRMLQVLWRLDQQYRALALRGLNPVFLVAPKEPNLARRPPLVIPEDPAEAADRRRTLLESLRQLTENPAGLDRGDTAESYRTVRQLAARAWFKPPTPDEFLLFEQTLGSLTQPILKRWDRAQRNLVRLKRPEPVFGGRLLNRLARRGAPRPVDVEDARASPSTPPRTPTSNESEPGTP
ncbi:rhomboid family intramembrane serine protease [Tautonia sp. JC769]|uniref:rhomboid family intramembrane serine protease n=1 Tax=Tautonia sp. JC769 TaxID=3232135 RepID=UPI003459CDA6